MGMPRPWDLGLWNVLKLRFGVNLFRPDGKVEINKPIILFGREITEEAVVGLLGLFGKKEESGEDLFEPRKKGR